MKFGIDTCNGLSYIASPPKNKTTSISQFNSIQHFTLKLTFVYLCRIFFSLISNDIKKYFVTGILVNLFDSKYQSAYCLQFREHYLSYVCVSEYHLIIVADRCLVNPPVVFFAV